MPPPYHYRHHKLPLCGSTSTPAACPWLSTLHAALHAAGLLPHDPLFALLPPAAAASRSSAPGPEHAAAAVAAAAARAAALASAAGWGRVAERGLAAPLLPAAVQTCCRKRGSSGPEGATVPGTATPAQALAAGMAAGKRQRLLLLTAATAGAGAAATPAHGAPGGGSSTVLELPLRHAGRRVARDLSFTPAQQQQEQQTGAHGCSFGIACCCCLWIVWLLLVLAASVTRFDIGCPARLTAHSYRLVLLQAGLSQPARLPSAAASAPPLLRTALAPAAGGAWSCGPSTFCG